MPTDNPFDDDAILTPADVLRVSRGVLRQSDVVAMVRAALTAAITADDGPARAFLLKIAYPEKTGEVEDLRFKRGVFCSFEQFNEINKLKAEIERLTKRNEELNKLLDDELGTGPKHA